MNGNLHVRLFEGLKLVTVLAYSASFKPLLTALKTTNPYALCNILSCQNSSGETPLHHSGRFQRALPLIKALTVNNLSLLPLSVCNNDGQSVLDKPGNFKTLLPFLFDLVETNFIQVKSIMMLKDQKNLPTLHIHENFKTAWPFLEQMAKKNFEEFMKLMTDDDGCSPLIDVENLSVAMPFLVQLARNHQTRELKSLLTIEGIRGLTLLHYSDNFEITLPLLEELLTIDPDLVIFLLSRHDNNQETPLHNSVIFSDAVRNQTKDKIGVKLRFLFREIFRKNPSLLKTLWTLRNAVKKTPLHNPVNFKIAIPILLACAQTSPDLTIEILSCQDEKGICPLHTPANFYFALSLLNELASGHPQKTKDLLNLPSATGITYHDYKKAKETQQQPVPLTPANHVLNFEEAEPILNRIDALLKK